MISTVIGGNITIDDIVLPDGQTNMGVIGGDVLYSALGYALWDDGCGMLSRMGDDFDQSRLEQYKKRNIDLGGMVKAEGPSVNNWVLYEYDGRRHFIYRTDPRRLDELSPLAEDIPDAYKGAKYCFLAAMPIEKQTAIARFYNGRGATVLLDPYEESVSNEAELVRESLRYVDYFLPSEEEEFRFFGNHDHERNIRTFAGMGPGVVVIKLAEKGAMVYDRKADCLRLMPAFVVKPVDPTGAGDAFGGGFTAGLRLSGGDPFEAALYGAVSASFAIEGMGSTHLTNVTFDDARLRMQKLKEQMKQGS